MQTDANIEGRQNLRFSEALNPSQLEAVYYDQGPLLVIAGAGSGKTRTLTYRVARLVAEGTPPSAILLLTFTRKASAEMLHRAVGLLDQRCGRVSGGTFHSFANAMLHKFSAAAGFEDGFAIIDRADAESLIAMVRKDLGCTAKGRSFPRKQTLAGIFSQAVNKVQTIEEVLFRDYSHFSQYRDDIVSIAEEYRRRKAELHFLDYDDLLVFFRRLLETQPEICERIARTYRYVMVDEYQDTNQIQADIIYLLSSTNRNVMVVGDDSQSIYAFRGANFQNIMNFPDRFPGTHIIRLEENYRSKQPILSFTNALISQASQKFTKTLFTRAAGGAAPALVNTATENGQSLYIIDRIRELQSAGVALHDMAVLFRAGFHSFDLEIELTREQIPFIKVGGFRFVESAHIKDVLAHLRVLSHPADRLSWYRVLLLLDKIGPKSAKQIYDAILAQESGVTGILTMQHRSSGTPAIQRLRELIARLDTREMTVAQMGEAVVNYYHPLLKSLYDDHPKRLKDLEHLVEIMARYSSLEQFLVDMALEPPTTAQNNVLAPEDSREERLVLSTIHSAKGLEWHTVFVIWTLDGRFPSLRAAANPEDMEEELRLLYVAATRAKRNLYFTHPSQAYDRATGTILCKPSRFLEVISEELLERCSVELNDIYYSQY